MADGIRRSAELLSDSLPEFERAAAALALPFSYTGRMFVIGRGIEFATAREIALKLLETCRVAAEPLTATDLAHGPVAALDPLFPVWAIASPDATLPTVQEAALRIHEMGATVVASGTAAAAIAGSQYVLPVPLTRAGSAVAAPLGRPGPALRGRAGPGARSRPRRAPRAEQGHARALRLGYSAPRRGRDALEQHVVQEAVRGDRRAAVDPRDPCASLNRPPASSTIG